MQKHTKPSPILYKKKTELPNGVIILSHIGERRRESKSRHLVIWFRVTRRPKCIVLIRNYRVKD